MKATATLIATACGFFGVLIGLFGGSVLTEIEGTLLVLTATVAFCSLMIVSAIESKR